jgi:hypothetical protein
MPQITECARRLKPYHKFLSFRLKLHLLCEVASDGEEELDDDLVDAVTATTYSYVKAFWYMNREPKYSNSSYRILDSYLGMNELDFLLHFWVHKESFWKLLDCINDFEGFK